VLQSRLRRIKRRRGINSRRRQGLLNKDGKKGYYPSSGKRGAWKGGDSTITHRDKEHREKQEKNKPRQVELAKLERPNQKKTSRRQRADRWLASCLCECKKSTENEAVLRGRRRKGGGRPALEKNQPSTQKVRPDHLQQRAQG